MHQRRLRALVLLPAVLAAAVLAAAPPAAAGGGCHRPATEGRGTTLALTELCFSPNVLRVAPGTEVTIVNRDALTHPLGRPGGEWAWEGKVGDRVSVRLDRDGIYPFFCYAHPGMVGVVVAGDGRGRPLLGIPTANLDIAAGIAIPADGVYAGHLTDAGPEGSGEPQGGAPDNRGVVRPAAISVGTNPQFGTDRRVEAHVLDFDDDLYGHRVSVSFAHHLRGQATFADLDELIAQIKADVDQTRRLLSSPPGGTVRTGGSSRPTP